MDSASRKLLAANRSKAPSVRSWGAISFALLVMCASAANVHAQFEAPQTPKNAAPHYDTQELNVGGKRQKIVQFRPRGSGGQIRKSPPPISSSETVSQGISTAPSFEKAAETGAPSATPVGRVKKVAANLVGRQTAKAVERRSEHNEQLSESVEPLSDGATTQQQVVLEPSAPPPTYSILEETSPPPSARVVELMPGVRDTKAYRDDGSQWNSQIQQMQLQKRGRVRDLSPPVLQVKVSRVAAQTQAAQPQLEELPVPESENSLELSGSYQDDFDSFGEPATSQALLEELASEYPFPEQTSPQSLGPPVSQDFQPVVPPQSTQLRPIVDSHGPPEWLAEIRFPMLRYERQSELALVDAIHNAIEFAPEIDVLRADVGISEAEITRQKANFDWNQFIQANWDENNVPVGSALDGVAERLEQHTLATQTGIRRLNRLGGQFELAQELGLADSNSQFFDPQNQATANIALQYEQPLLQGAGRFVNTSIISIALADANISQEDFLAGLQSHVLDVVSAYWALVARRGEYIAQKRSYDRAAKTASIVANRVHLDVGPVQSARAEATLGARRTSLIQAEYAVVFAQEQLLKLIFGPKFKESVNTEIIPVSTMAGPLRKVAMEQELQVGLKNRPEIGRSLQLIKRSSIEQGVAKNQLLPALGLTMSLSNQGLRGNRALGGAINDQFGLGDPTYGVGLSYAFPVGNRAAKANLRQASLRVKRFQKEFETVISDVALEVRNAAHTISLNGKQREATAKAYQLAKRELEVLQKRTTLLIDGDQVGPLYLDNLLQTQERLATAELAYIDAASSYALAQFELQRATGTLLRTRPLPVEAASARTWVHRTHSESHR